MRIFRSYRRLRDDARGAVAAIGNFDGVHLGHRAAIDAARRIAADRRAPSAVLTFEPHPRSLFRPDDPPFRLTPFRAKATLLAGLGVDLMLAPRFDRRFAGIEAPDFVGEVLARGLGLRHVVCGPDFMFGHNRGGDAATLQRLGFEHGLGVTVIEPVRENELIYSSSAIRKLLQLGDPKGAARLLGRPFEVTGRVRRGNQLGRKLGFPTANVDHSDYLAPAQGVYAVRAAVDGANDRWLAGVANFGKRPTVDGLRLLLEVHLFDFTGDLYGKRLCVRMIDYLRPEKRFDGLDALKAQIAEDAANARRLLSAPPAIPLRKARP